MQIFNYNDKCFFNFFKILFKNINNAIVMSGNIPKVDSEITNFNWDISSVHKDVSILGNIDTIKTTKLGERKG